MTFAKRLLALTVACALVTPGTAATPGQQSDDAARVAIEAREAAIFPTGLRQIRAANGMVSGTSSPIAVEAGAQALRDGGTAADAAVATSLTQVTTMLGANVSHAGVVQLVYFEAGTGRIHVMDAGWGSWRGEQSPATIPDTDLSFVTGGAIRPTILGPAGRKMLVPGFMAGMEAMHRRFGRLRFARLVEPAIWYADHGVPVTGLLAGYFSIGTAELLKTPAGRRFALPDGTNPPKLGERFRQPELAALLRTVAREGARPMYRGAWAQHYVDAVRAAGGHATMAEMQAYAPRWGAPLRTLFDGAAVVGPDSQNTSSCAALEALNLIGHRGNPAAYWQDAEALRITALALRIAITGHYGPAAAAFERRAGVGGTCEARVGPEYGAAVSRAMEEILGGPVGPGEVGHHSASVVAVDRWGNVAALVHSSNTPLWGDSGVVVDGIPVPVPAGTYRHLLTALTPGARLPSDMAPVLLLEQGKPVLAVAAIGSSVVPETVRLVAGLRRRDADAARVIAAPALLLNYEQMGLSPLDRDELVPAGAYPAAVLEGLRARGIKVREVDAQRVLLLRGTAAVAAFGGAGKGWSGVEVPGVLAFAATQ